MSERAFCVQRIRLEQDDYLLSVGVIVGDDGAAGTTILNPRHYLRYAIHLSVLALKHLAGLADYL